MDEVLLRRRAGDLKALHVPGAPVVLVNAWDAATAVVVAQAGARAIATTSAGIAWALGYPDGQHITREEMLRVAATIAQAVDLPVTADLEAGYGNPDETVRRALDAGVAGMNLEDTDRSVPGDRRLFPLDAAVRNVAAARAAAERAHVHFVINARTDVILRNVGDARTRVPSAVERANAFLAAGADCAFVPGVRDAQTIGALVRGIRGPLNVLAVAGTPPLRELARLGVARVSLGSSPMRAMLATLATRSRAALEAGQLGPLVDEVVPYDDLQRWMADEA